MLTKLKQKIPLKPFLAIYLGALFLYFSLTLAQLSIFFSGLLIILLCAGADLLWTYGRDRIWRLPLSSIISGLILSLIALPITNLFFIILLPLVAVAGKHLITLGKPRHIFNPASLSVVLVSLFVPAISWSGVTGSQPLWWIILLVGLFILWRQNRWHQTLSFIIIYTLGLILIFILASHKITALPKLIALQFLYGPLIFFCTVMLIEPVTSTFPTKKQRIFYGAATGFFSALIALLNPGLDPLIYGLLLGNLIASLLFL